MSPARLQAEIERVTASDRIEPAAARALVADLFDALERGEVRAAEPAASGWVVNAWVKKGILLAFRHGADVAWDVPPLYFRDRDTLPPRKPGEGVRIVPGGSTARRGAHLGRGVVMMPPSFINVGAYIGEGSMIDSHALVGSCAQIGSHVHLSAAAQIGGVLEPVGALPVVVEDDAFVGGGCGLYEGVRVGRGAVLAPSVVLTRAVTIFDLPNERTIAAGPEGVLEVPDRAVVVPGSRPASGRWAEEVGLALYAPIIVKYRDAKTDASSALEEALR